MTQVNRRHLIRTAIATVCCGTWGPLSVAQGNRPSRRVAIGGHDPVAYFTAGRPVKGSSSFSFPFDEADYYFASAEHQKMFSADPDRYAPQYSGYCAIGVSMDQPWGSPLDPTASCKAVHLASSLRGPTSGESGRPARVFFAS